MLLKITLAMAGALAMVGAFCMPDNSLDLANFLQNAVKNNSGDGWGFGNGGGFLWLLVLLLFGFGGGYGFGGRGFGAGTALGGGALINDAAITGAVDTAIARARAAGISDDLMLQAVNGNKEALSNIANALNCDMSRVNDALSNIKCAIDKVAGEIGMTSQQVINAVQAGNASIISQMQSCCCDVKNAITSANYENQIAVLNQTNAITSQMQSQTALLSAKIDAQTQIINDKFCQLELRDQARIIDTQGNLIQDLKGRLSTQEILNAIANKTTTTGTPAA
nr:MAG TPA: hypothetical protein [Caudoviricetes sp.]